MLRWILVFLLACSGPGCGYSQAEWDRQLAKNEDLQQRVYAEKKALEEAKARLRALRGEE